MAQNTQRGIAVLLAWLLLLAGTLPVRAEDTVILAEKVAPSELAAGDRIVIVHGPARRPSPWTPPAPGWPRRR